MKQFLRPPQIFTWLFIAGLFWRHCEATVEAAKAIGVSDARTSERGEHICSLDSDAISHEARSPLSRTGFLPHFTSAASGVASSWRTSCVHLQRHFVYFELVSILATVFNVQSFLFLFWPMVLLWCSCADMLLVPSLCPMKSSKLKMTGKWCLSLSLWICNWFFPATDYIASWKSALWKFSCKLVFFKCFLGLCFCLVHRCTIRRDTCFFDS